MTEHFDRETHLAHLAARRELVTALLDLVNDRTIAHEPPAWFDGPLPAFDAIDDEDSAPVRTYAREFGGTAGLWSVSASVEDFDRDHGLERSAASIHIDAPDWVEFDADEARAIAAALIAAADALDRE